MKHLSALLLSFIFLSSCSPKEDTDKNENIVKVTVGDTDRVAEVTVMELRPTVFNHEIVSNGHISAQEKVDVNFQTPGMIAAIYVRNGQRVAKGQRIASLDTYKLDNQLEKERNAVASATLEMQDVLIGQGYDPEHPENVPDDVMKLARLRSGLQQAELTLAATKKEHENATLTAPISGVVANLSANAHNMASTSQPLCRIINDGGMDVEFSVLESELPMVKLGDEIVVTPFSATNTHKGHVTEINPMVDDNGMVKVWAAVDGGRGLIDGMNVRISVKRAVDKALVVPKSAVVLRTGRQVIFTLDGNKAMWNYVTTGLENLNEYIVTDGLTSGMTVITTGNVNLAHETTVKVLK